jgi:hypothetical protein
MIKTIQDIIKMEIHGKNVMFFVKHAQVLEQALIIIVILALMDINSFIIKLNFVFLKVKNQKILI